MVKRAPAVALFAVFLDFSADRLLTPDPLSALTT
jgi:hypothetical protein